MLKKIKYWRVGMTGDKQQIFRNSFWLFVGEFSSKLFIFLLTIAIARSFTAESFGRVSFALAFISIFMVFMDLGLSMLIVREVAREKSRINEFFSAGIRITGVCGVFLVFFSIILISRMPISPVTRWVVYGFLGYGFIGGFSSLLKSFVRATENMHYEAIARSAQGLMIFIIGGGIIWYSRKEIWFAAAYLIGALVSLIILMYTLIHRLNVKFIPISGSFIWRTLRMALPLGLASVSFMVYNHVDKIMLGVMQSERAVGVYGAGYNLLEVGMMIAVLVSQAIVPLMVKRRKISEDRLRGLVARIKYFYLITPLLIILFILFFGEKLILLIYGGEYSQSIVLTKVLFFTLIPTFLNNLYGNVVIIKDKQNIYFYGVAGGLIANILLNLLLIPYYSYLGAAVATIVSEVIPAIVFIIATQRIK